MTVSGVNERYHLGGGGLADPAMNSETAASGESIRGGEARWQMYTHTLMMHRHGVDVRHARQDRAPYGQHDRQYATDGSELLLLVRHSFTPLVMCQ